MKNSIKLSLLALAVSQVLNVQMAQAAEDAQENTAEDQDIEVIAVKGFGGALGKALREKRFSPSTVEIISSDDLGTLPDVSITDSLVRLPGIAASRDRGNASRISIRGMGPRLNVATMNNREIVSAEPSRDVRFEQFPAELIDGVEVYKSPLASKAEGGISGLVNMNFVSPLSKDKRLINFGASYMYNTLADDLPDADGGGYKANFSIVDQVSEKFGYAFGLTYQDQPSIEKGVQSWDYNNGVNRGDMNENGKVEDAPWGVMAKSKRGNNERTGGLLILEFQPTEALNIKGDLFYSQFDIQERDDQQGPNDLGNWADDGSGPRGYGYDLYHNAGLNPVIEDSGDGSEQVVAGVQEWGGAQLSIPKWFQKNEMLSAGIKMTYVGDTWTTKFDVGVSEASIESVWINIEPVYVGGDYLVGFNASGDKAQPLMVGGVNDPANYAFSAQQEVWYETSPDVWEPTIETTYATMTGDSQRELTDEMGNINLDFERDLDFGVLSKFAFGARVTDRTKENVQLANWTKTANVDHGLTDFGEVYSIGSDYAFDPSVFGNDPAWQALVDKYQITSDDLEPHLYTFKNWDKVASAAFGGTGTPADAEVDDLASWKLKEKNTALYVQFEMVGDLAGIPYSGNFGVRYAKTEVDSIGHEMDSYWYEGDDGNWYEAIVITPTAVKHEYDEILPSLNMIFNITDDSQIRFGLARTMSRPPLLEMRTGFSFNTQSVPYTASGGNPKLDPYVANQLDLGYEYYWGDNSMASVNYFFKDLQSHIGLTEGNVSFNGEDYAFTGTMNGDGGVIQGIEVLYQQSFDMLPEPFDGLGIYANYSYTDSDVKEFKPENNPYNLGGLSKHIGSATLWYDKNGFDARFSVNYRSEYTGVNSWDPQLVNLNSSETTADASIGYFVTENLKLTLQAQNLTNESSENYWDNDYSKPAYSVEWGRRYLVGFQYSM
ncbi:TonB-dependent receptor [Catenovulum sp. 2E275]|uniref:TonB-dependent receptor n=1 Tax=Catenovulum sp. 2E275 TaxID=2980497 RepID=UPI0021D10FFD|nr:TonB-dependent receptor [Catenovulum sp. 2E275]MCU4674138.1 TonB-dependent receptor [Catenovulum sp. 2E275]